MHSRTAGCGAAAGTEGSASGSVAQQRAPSCFRTVAQGGQRRDHRVPHRTRNLVEDGREKDLCGMERTYQPHSQVGRYSARSKDGHLRSRRRQPLSHPEGLVGSRRLALQHQRLCAGIALGESGDRSSRRRQSQPGHRRARGQSQSHSQGAQGS